MSVRRCALCEATSPKPSIKPLNFETLVNQCGQTPPPCKGRVHTDKP
jgi:hypothetical protein